MEWLGYTTRSSAKQAIRDLESLRNNLAHAQDVAEYDWIAIVRLSKYIEETLRRRG